MVPVPRAYYILGPWFSVRAMVPPTGHSICVGMFLVVPVQGGGAIGIW